MPVKNPQRIEKSRLFRGKLEKSLKERKLNIASFNLILSLALMFGTSQFATFTEKNGTGRPKNREVLPEVVRENMGGAFEAGALTAAINTGRVFTFQIYQKYTWFMQFYPAIAGTLTEIVPLLNESLTKLDRKIYFIDYFTKICQERGYTADPKDILPYFIVTLASILFDQKLRKSTKKEIVSNMKEEILQDFTAEEAINMIEKSMENNWKSWQYFELREIGLAVLVELRKGEF